MIKLIVFDFDGTLVDTKKIIYGIIWNLIEKSSYQISKKLIQKELGNSSLEISLESLKVNPKDAKNLEEKSNYLSIKNASKMKMVRNLRSLNKLKQRKIILSNNITPFIESVLKNLKVDFFDEVYGADKFKDKPSKLNQLIKKFKLKPSEVIYIGDKTVDVDVARKSKCIAVSIVHKASWSPKKEILAKNPDYIITDLTQLKKIISLYR
jgi:phosphoglycolate phosphatase